MTDIEAGFYFSLILTENSSQQKLFSCGNNSFGQLGVNNTNDSSIFIQVITPFSDRIIQISSGNSFSLLLTSKNQVWSWGDNNYGQLGLGSFYPFYPLMQLINYLGNITKIQTGYHYSLFLKNTKEVYSVGYNNVNF